MKDGKIVVCVKRKSKLRSSEDCNLRLYKPETGDPKSQNAGWLLGQIFFSGALSKYYLGIHKYFFFLSRISLSWCDGIEKDLFLDCPRFRTNIKTHQEAKRFVCMYLSYRRGFLLAREP